MRIGLVTDSPSDIPEDLVKRYKIEVVPATLVLGGKSYLDGVEISREEFYQRLPALKTAPTTAAPSTGDFAARYWKLLESSCEQIIGIFTAETLTSIPNIARKAADDFPGKVTVIESGSLTLGIGFQVLAAAEAIEKGLDMQAVLAVIQSTRRRIRVYAALDTMEYLRRSGRVAGPVAALGGLLSIKPVVELREGQVKPMGTPRTTSKATEKLYSLVNSLGPLERLAIVHTNAETRAREFFDKLKAGQPQFLPADIQILNVTPVIGTHLGPNGLGVAAVKEISIVAGSSK
jgi:DegV family protein with EDD domain